MVQLSGNAKISSSTLQLLRYGVVGVLSNFILYCAYLLITFLGLEHKIAMTLMYLIGTTISFVVNRKWTFAHNGNMLNSAFRYVVAHLFGYILNFLILFIFVDHLGYAHQLIQFIATFVVAGYLFVAFKFLVFTSLKAPKGDRL